MPKSNIVNLDELLVKVAELRREMRSIVFTNGCFDLLHRGHLKCLEFAAKQGDVLIVAVNSDSSVRALKGPGRPIVPQADRAWMVAALECVDLVTVFDQAEPAELIVAIKPDVLVKGSDAAGYISGADLIESYSGHVMLFPRIDGISTTRIIETVRS